VEKSVKNAVSSTQYYVFPAAPPNREDNFVTTSPTIHTLRQELGGILKVSIYHRYGRPSRIVKPGRYGSLMTEVAREADHFKAWVFPVDARDELVRFVTRAVIDENRLPSDAQRVESANETGSEKRQDVLLVIARYYDAEFRGSRSVVRDR
jgi:hypothetical protein